MQKQNKPTVFINDTCISIPFFSREMQRKIITELENKKRRGYVIKRIEVDDVRQCVIYEEPNYEKIYN